MYPILPGKIILAPGHLAFLLPSDYYLWIFLHYFIGETMEMNTEEPSDRHLELLAEFEKRKRVGTFIGIL